MAKMFYSAKEAAAKLGKAEAELKDLVRAGTLREFRDGDNVNYKVEEIDALAAASGSGAVSGSASGEIILEPADDSGIDLSGSGSDILSLEELDSGDSSAQTASGKEDTAGKQKKGDSVVPSVGVNVFDDDELDEAVDPLAQTAVTDVGGLGIDGIGSGSGILDLTKESDDTSLGAELLDEIYSDDDATADAGEDTRPGLDDAIEEGAGGEKEFDVVIEPDAERPASDAAVARGAYAPEAESDAMATSLTAALVVGIVVLWFAGLAGAAMVRGVVPALLRMAYENLMIFAGGAFGLAILCAGVVFLVARRGSQ